jgi:predicted  nucleic acid-binding Zn-ribbon protein
MSKVTKLTPKVLKRIIQEERKRIALQKKKIQEAKNKKRVDELRKELKAYTQLKREQKFLVERIKKIQNRTKTIKRKIKES